MTATDWEQLLFTALTTSGTSLYTLIGTRVYPVGDMPQGGTFPAVEYTVVSDPEEWDTWGIARVQLDCYSTTYAGARAVRDAIRARFKNYAGTRSATDRIENVDTSAGGPAGHNKEEGWYSRVLDVKILHITRG